MDNKKLRGGYTTGVHASYAFKSALSTFIAYDELSVSKTNKMDNDDLDVTKGCEIVLSISQNLNDLVLNKLEHKAYIFEHNNTKLHIYASNGVGIVTKRGLKPPVGYCAINPVPLTAIKDIFESLSFKIKQKDIFCTVGVTNGEIIAKQTANSKVGVLGGISILGTKGIVKPISSSAYIDSIKTEISFAKDNGYETIYFTLGNSSFEEVKKYNDPETIIEIGNFVYDSFKIAQYLKIKKVIFLCGIGKMTKVAQGFKNTHNRFGVIDFELLQDNIFKDIGYKVDIETTHTVKGISHELNTLNRLTDLYKLISKNANEQIKQWFPTLNVEAIILEDKKVL
jgi:cobalt-precorrin-5B (C1)-methyltransferase